MEHSNQRQEQARVVLIDESSVVLDELEVALSMSSRLVVAGTGRTTGEALALIRTCRPAVVVLDVRVGPASGITLCGVLRESYPSTAVLFFTNDDDRHTLWSAILAGAQGYLLKGASTEVIVKSIEHVAVGRSTIDQRLTPQLLAWIRDRKRISSRKRVDDCSGADRRILSLIAVGQSNTEIARELNVTPSAVTARLRAVFKRLKISRRSEAARYFVEWEKEQARCANRLQ